MDRWHLRTPVSSLNEIERKESLGTSLGEVRISLREPPWASLVAQLVLPAMWETWVWSLGREDPLGWEKGRATHSSILAWRTPWTVCGRKESDTTEWLFSFTLGEVGGGDESVHLRRLEPSWSLLVNWAQLQASSRHLFLSTVSTVGQELENFRPVSLIWPATCFCKELFIWIQSCLPVYVSSSGAFTTWAKDCCGKAGNIYQSALSSKSLPPLLWGVDLTVCWKQGGEPLEVPAQERQRAQTQRHKAVSLASNPARLIGW